MKRKGARSILAGVVSAGLLLAALVPSAVAAPPRWSMTVTQLVPSGVSAGAAQGFAISITNRGPSNISALYLLDDVPDPVAYIDASRGGCNAAGAPLFCSFGALGAGQTITLTVAFAMPFASGTGDVIFEINSTGLVTGKNNSHGDAFKVPQSVTVFPGGSDRAGSWTLAPGQVVANGQAVGAGNVQATKVGGIGPYVPVALEDGAGVSFTCPKQACKAKPFGEWSRVSVAGGSTFATAFEVTITVAKASLPANTDPSKVIVFHVLDGGAVETISTSCGATPPAGGAPECRTASFDAAGNLVIRVFVYKNGGFRGGL